jgi:RNA polymerase sigma factor (TIGR02999 family)
MTDVTQILSQIESGDPSAAEQLLPLVYEELRKLAAARLALEKPGQTLQATALVHEAWLRLASDDGTLDRSRFFAAAAQAMRDVLVERVRARLTQKRGGGRARSELHDELPEIAPAVGIHDLLGLDAALQELQAQHPDEAMVVLRRFFAGQTHGEIARDLGVVERTVERRWRFARAFLGRRLGGVAGLEDA